MLAVLKFPLALEANHGTMIGTQLKLSHTIRQGNPTSHSHQSPVSALAGDPDLKGRRETRWGRYAGEVQFEETGALERKSLGKLSDCELFWASPLTVQAMRG